MSKNIPIDDLIPEAQEGAQIRGRLTTEEGSSHRAIVIALDLSLEEAQGHHGVSQDAQGPARDANPLSQFVQSARSCCQVRKQPDLVGHKEVLRGREVPPV